jgi:glycosyltransferase involved in cell wall biosynthesis
MNYGKITVVILTKNEEKNIFRCLNSLKKFNKILVFDSHSKDNTLNICKKYKNVKIISTPSKISYVEKLNFILKKIKNEWILILDADYILSNGAQKEIQNFLLIDNYGYQFKIFNKVLGRVIYKDLYPSKTLLFNVKNIKFKQDGHKEKTLFYGKKKLLKSYIVHDDQKKFSLWFLNQIRYAKLESRKIFLTKYKLLKREDKIRKIPFAMNVASFVYYYFYKGLYKFGLSGIYYVFQRQIYEFILSIYIFYFLLLK